MTNIVILYCFGLIIPAIFILYAIGNLVYCIGEFKENLKTVPRILLLFLTELIILFFILVLNVHYIFNFKTNIDLISIAEIITIISGLYIIIDSITNSKLISKYNDFLETDEYGLNLSKIKVDNMFPRYLKTSTLKIRNYYQILYILKNIIIISLVAIIIYKLITDFNIFDLIVISIYCMLFAFKLFIMKFISSL